MNVLSPLPSPVGPGALIEYLVDAAQRRILFLDVMRRRGNTAVDHALNGKPPTLDFRYEVLIDAKSLDEPCNYFLTRIVPPAGTVVDEASRPIVIFDPRAGHGPGIGGSKPESEIGESLRAGHPTYFVGFHPEPVEGQRLIHIARAIALFLQKVAEKHPGAGAPVVYANCQAGWMTAMVAAAVPDLAGPLILNGSPLSYWAGRDGQNPMRYLGGLYGGSWMSSLVADAAGGIFDGAHLVSNFESLNPANTYWSKDYNLYSKVDTEAERYLGFEKWWSGYFRMTADEYAFIVQDLFVGNKLARGELRTPEGAPINLKNIKNPIVVFASRGDNITPPQQALNWIADVYDKDEDIVRDEQVIVYRVHENIGHLGIFVAGSVARKEHAQIIQSIEAIDALPPGLYEMVIEPKAGKVLADTVEPGDYTLRFERRTLADIQLMDDGREDEALFSTIAQVSQTLQSSYDTFLAPFVKSVSSKAVGDALALFHPLRVQHFAYADVWPWMFGVAPLAELARKFRQPVAADNPFLQAEEGNSDAIAHTLKTFGETRDAWTEQIVRMIYGPFGIGAFVPPSTAAPERDPRREAEIAERVLEVSDRYTVGGLREAFVRALLLVARRTGGIRRRGLLITNRLRSRHPELGGMSLDQVKALIHEQTLLVELDPAKAAATIGRLVPTRAERERLAELCHELVAQASTDAETDGNALEELVKQDVALEIGRAHV